MQSAFYVTLSSQIALDKRLATIAENVANATTTGFRATGVSFDQVLSRTAPTTTAFVSTGVDYISRASGGLTKTDNPLDVAVVGNAWFAIQTPQGVAGPVANRVGICWRSSERHNVI
jgi:flagellar basal-body rod protein FlgF